MSYILIDITTKASKINDSTIHVFTWLDEITLELHETIVDDSYRNYNRNGWKNIINDSYPYGRYTGLKPAYRKTQKNVKVIDADSFPRKLEELTEDEICAIAEKKNRIDRGNKTTYNDLFE